MKNYFTERQIAAYEKPIYQERQINDPLYFEEMIIGRLKVRTKVVVLGFFANEMWSATAFVEDENGAELKSNDLSAEENAQIRELLNLLLTGVGKSEIHYIGQETDFEAFRFLTARELKKLAKPDLEKIFEIRARQQLALENPAPPVEELIAGKFTKVVDCGGMYFSTILTIERSSGSFRWHASSCVLDEHKRPVKLFETPFGYGKLNMELPVKFLNNVGSGPIRAIDFKQSPYVVNMWRALSHRERQSLPHRSWIIRLFTPRSTRKGC